LAHNELVVGVCQRERRLVGTPDLSPEVPCSRPFSGDRKLGLSNVEIAERLVLSTRTVESHLYRSMQKLGISDRRDL
jgi:hypothetical protein